MPPLLICAAFAALQVRLVFSRQSAAARLEQILKKHAAAISKLNLLVTAPTLAATASAATAASTTNSELSLTLQDDVLEYLLDTLRERHAAGCFTPVYPSLHHHAKHTAQLEVMEKANPRRGGLRRLQMHTLIGIILADLDAESSAGRGGGVGEVGAGGGGFGATAAGGGGSFERRCKQMLREVPPGREGAFAKRTHIFKDLRDLPS